MSRVNRSRVAAVSGPRAKLTVSSLIAVMGLLPGALEPSASKLQGRSPSDAEIRVTRLVSSVETTLTVLLHGSRGDLPVSFEFRAVHENRPRSDRPSELGLSLLMSPLFGGSLDLKLPHVVLIVDESLADADFITASVDGPLFSIGSGSIDVLPVLPFDADTLSRLERATTVSGRVFSLEFTVTPEQVRSIGEFARRVRQRPK